MTAGVVDYLNWRGDLTFEKSPLCEVDFYILCKFGSPDFTGIVPREGEKGISQAVEEFFSIHDSEKDMDLGVLSSPFEMPMMRRIPTIERFRELRVRDFVNTIDPERGEQFSAITVLLPDGARFVAFKGTDDTILGWKEDFLLAVEDSVPAQKDAAAYLLREAERFDGPIYVAGHSKGGNLAVYAAMMAPPAVQSRIAAVYNFDGPGFRSDVSESPEYAGVGDKIHTVLSQHAIVGRLLFPGKSCTIVKAQVRGPLAHDGFRWEVMGTQFVRCKGFSASGNAIEAAMTDVTGNMDIGERREFIEELFSALTSTGAVTVSELTEKGLRQDLEIAQGMRKSPEVRKFISALLTTMVKTTAATVNVKVKKPSLYGLYQAVRKPAEIVEILKK